MALAGWAAEDIEVSTESNVLLIKSKTSKGSPRGDYMHRGVATRTFARGFNLSDDVEVGTVELHKRDACGRIAEDHPRSSETEDL